MVTDRPALEKNRVALFAETMKLAHAKTQAATLLLQSGAAAPEGKESLMNSLQALSLALNQGNRFLKAEEDACRETGMSFDEFREIRTRLIQVKMLDLLENNYGELLSMQSGNEMQQNALDQVNRKLDRHKERLQRSLEQLKKAEASEENHYGRLDLRIERQQESIERLKEQLGSACSEEERQRRERSLRSAEDRLEKMKGERKQPYRALVRATENVEKHRKELETFREKMPLIIAKITKLHQEVQEGQDRMAGGMRQLLNADLMQQARLDRPAFKAFPGLKVFAIQK
jgi:chromosome segregation ATPase